MTVHFILDDQGHMWASGASEAFELPFNESLASNSFTRSTTSNYMTLGTDTFQKVSEEKWLQVVSSSLFGVSYAIKADGSLWGCGNGAFLPSADESKKHNGTYFDFVLLDASKWKKIIAHSYGNPTSNSAILAIKEDGTPYSLAFGQNAENNIKLIFPSYSAGKSFMFKLFDEKVIDISMLHYNTVGGYVGFMWITEDNQIKVILSNSNQAIYKPADKNYLEVISNYLPNSFKKLAASSTGIFMLSVNGELYSIGSGETKGASSTRMHSYDMQPLLTGVKDIIVSQQNDAAFALMNDGTIKVVGSTTIYTGSSSVTFVDIGFTGVAKDISVKFNTLLIKDQYNDLYVCGYLGNTSGVGATNSFIGGLEVSRSTTAKNAIRISHKKHPQRFAKITGSSAGTNIYAIDEDGILWGKGINSLNQLGPSTITDKSSFIQLSEKKFKKVMHNLNRVTALAVDGEMMTMGNQGTLANLIIGATTVSELTKFINEVVVDFDEDAYGNFIALTEGGEIYARGGIAAALEIKAGSYATAPPAALSFRKITNPDAKDFASIKLIYTTGTNIAGGFLGQKRNGDIYHAGTIMRNEMFLPSNLTTSASTSVAWTLGLNKTLDITKDHISFPIKLAQYNVNSGLYGYTLMDAVGRIYSSSGVAATQSILNVYNATVETIAEINAHKLGKYKDVVFKNAQMIGSSAVLFETDTGVYAGGSESDHKLGIPGVKSSNSLPLKSYLKSGEVMYFHPIPIRDMAWISSAASAIIDQEGQIRTAGYATNLNILEEGVYGVMRKQSFYPELNYPVVYNILEMPMESDLFYPTNEVMTAILKARVSYEINRFEVKGQAPAGTALRLYLSTDKTTWKVFKDGTWTVQTPESILTNGMTIQEVNALTKGNLTDFHFKDFYVMAALWTENEKLSPYINSFNVFVNVNSEAPSFGALSLQIKNKNQITPMMTLESDGVTQELPHGEMIEVKNPSQELQISMEIDQNVSVDGYAATWK